MSTPLKISGFFWFTIYTIWLSQGAETKAASTNNQAQLYLSWHWEWSTKSASPRYLIDGYPHEIEAVWETVMQKCEMRWREGNSMVHLSDKALPCLHPSLEWCKGSEQAIGVLSALSVFLKFIQCPASRCQASVFQQETNQNELNIIYSTESTERMQV